MFDLFRKSVSSVFGKIFLAVIIIVFVFWGIGSFTDYRKEIVAEVNRDKITLSQFQEYYNFKYTQLKQTLGDISQEDLQKMRLKETVLEELIEQKLIEQIAKKYGIRVTDEELKLAITHTPAFQEKGSFNPARYQSFLRSLNLTPKAFEELIRADILRQKLANLISAPIIVSEMEVDAYYNFQNQKLEVLELSLPFSVCAREVRWTEGELESFFHARRDRYVEDEKVKLAYLFIPYKGEVEVTEEELKRYYQENIERFKEPYRVKVRRILIAGKGEEALNRAREIRTALKELKDFDRFSGQKGEWVEVDVLPEELKNLIRVAKVGDILGPLEGKDGYLILGIEEVKQERYLKYEEVRSRLLSELKEQKIKARVKAKANEFFAKIIAEDGLVKWADKNNAKLEETSFLTTEELSKFFMSRDTAKNIIKKQRGDTLPPIETGRGVYIVQILEKQPKRNLTFNEAKNMVKEDFIAEKAKTLCEAKAQEFINKSKNERDLGRFAEVAGFQVKFMKALRRDLPEMLNNRGVPGLIESYSWMGRDLKMFAILSIEDPPEKPKDEEKRIYRQILLEYKRHKSWMDLLQKERSKAKVKIYPVFQQL